MQITMQKMLLQNGLLHTYCLLSLVVAAAATAPAFTKPDCPSKCGDLKVPYPFGIGIGSGCSINATNPWLDIHCNYSSNPPKPYLFNTSFEVVNITETQIYIKDRKRQLGSACMINNTMDYNDILHRIPSPYSLSDENQITALGCDDMVTVQMTTVEKKKENGPRTLGIGGDACVPYCSNKNGSGSCPGKGCCRTSTLKTNVIAVQLYNMSSFWGRESRLFPCSVSFLGKISNLPNFTFPLSLLENWTTFLNNKEFMDYPLVLDWRIDSGSCTESQNSWDYACQKNSRCIDFEPDVGLGGYRCSCKEGYHGNPYLSHSGCEDINECYDFPCASYAICTNTPGSYNCSCPVGYYGDGKKDGIGCSLGQASLHSKIAIGIGLGVGMGFLLLLSTCLHLYKFHKKRKSKKSKEKLFKRLLQQQISKDGDILETTRLFTAKELEKATDHFNKSRILGQGGQGTVYKGMLSDGKIVAIKKSKLIDEDQAQQFINEVVMLSQIIHRNVVKLLGCCLETQVPLLVYEFISNGTLFDHIHDESDEFSLLWSTRLKIAVEVAEAVAYLHSATTIPIYHRDIKSTNILLDEKYVAKVSDFGISRSIAVDQTHLTTLVKGTFGYLDPEYFRSSQFTEKSDVYSFGIVLVELLTGQRPISSDRTIEERSLAARFLSCVEVENLESILDAKLLEQGKREELIAAAKLAQLCLNLNGKNRPTMREVAMELEGIRMSQTLSTASETKYQGIQLSKSKAILISNNDYTWTSTSDHATSSSDACPLKIHTV